MGSKHSQRIYLPYSVSDRCYSWQSRRQESFGLLILTMLNNTPVDIACSVAALNTQAQDRVNLVKRHMAEVRTFDIVESIKV